MSETRQSDSRQIRYGEPGYWDAVRKVPEKPAATAWAPVVLEPMTTITTCPFSSISWYLKNAEKFGWRVWATRARHLQPPSSGGERAGQWVDYCSIAVRLNCRERNLAAWAVWWFDVQRSKWQFEAAQWAFVTSWNGDSPASVTILKAHDGTVSIQARELQCLIKGEPFEPVKRKPKEGAADAKPKASRKKRDVS